MKPSTEAKSPSYADGSGSSRTRHNGSLGRGGATPAERWSVGHRIRDVEVGPDGALWMLEDANPGGLFRVMPK
jgi:glucose/arabinose dehydrogenase